MLKIQSLQSFHLQAILQSIGVLRRTPWVSLMICLVIAISLALPAFFWVFTDNFSEFTTHWQRNGHISLYLKPMSAHSQQDLLKKVRETQGVGEALLKSPADGLAELINQEGMHDIMRYLPENPLPAVIEIIPAFLLDSPSLRLLTEKLKLLPKVEQVKSDMEWVTRLRAILNALQKLARTLMLLLAMSVVLIIAMTLRLAIHHRQEEIQVLKLIGASQAYILRPFLYSGVWYGLIGSVFAVFIVNILAFGLGLLMNQFLSVYQMHYSVSVLSIRQILPLMAFAIILGWLAARLSVKGQLLGIEPYQ